MNSYAISPPNTGLPETFRECADFFGRCLEVNAIVLSTKRLSIRETSGAGLQHVMNQKIHTRILSPQRGRRKPDLLEIFRMFYHRGHREPRRTTSLKILRYYLHCIIICVNCANFLVRNSRILLAPSPLRAPSFGICFLFSLRTLRSLRENFCFVSFVRSVVNHV